MECRWLGGSSRSRQSASPRHNDLWGGDRFEPKTHAQLDAFVAGGSTFIDTADVRRAPEVVGEWLRKTPGTAFHLDDEGPLLPYGRVLANERGQGQHYLNGGDGDKEPESGLGGGGDGQILDLYQSPRMDPQTPLEETVGSRLQDTTDRRRSQLRTSRCGS